MARGRVGDPEDTDTEVGPLVNESQLDDVVDAVERGKSEGGTVLAGGKGASHAPVPWLPVLTVTTAKTSRRRPCFPAGR